MSRKAFFPILILMFAALACQALGFGAGEAEAFDPAEDTTLEAGEHIFTELTIAAGVEVTVEGDVLLEVDGAVNIEGDLVGDCAAIELRGGGELTLDGLIENTCSDPDEDPADVRLIVDGDLTLGASVSDDPVIVSDGEVFIADSGGEQLDLTPILPEEESSSIFRWPVAHRAAPARQGGGAAAVNRPIRAGRGQNVSVVKEQGDLAINANQTAQDGDDAPALNQNGACDNSNNLGGTGGSVRLAVRNGTLTIGNGVRLEAGDGGQGGSCTAAAGCPATAIAGRGGLGGSVLLGAQVIDFGAGVVIKRGNGGPGGDAEAVADSATQACQAGCEATATGGKGGDAGGIGYLILEPGRINGAPTVEGTNGGKGGMASADGGDGADCDQCPGGVGGDGGNATATGGQGGNGARGTIRAWPMAPGTHLKGDGGDARVDAGFGGEGATCCNPPQQGGNGGKGGDATATGGQIGARGIGGGGVRGASQAWVTGAGDGGDGGDGLSPGSGGDEGKGSGDPNPLPDGFKGLDGNLCLIPLGGIFLVDVIIILDPAGHGPFIAMPNFITLEVIVVIEDGTITILGPFPWVLVSGTIDQLGNFSASGTGTVAGYTNVQVLFEGLLTIDFLEGEYTMGADGGLPTGQAIVYSVSGPKEEQEDDSSSAGMMGHESLEEFVENLGTSLRTSNHAFSLDRLHPAVIERYGQEACQSYLNSIDDPSFDIEILEVGDTSDWDYQTDGLSTTVPNTYTVLANLTSGGETVQSEVHFAVGEDGKLRWFTDCGEPQAGAGGATLALEGAAFCRGGPSVEYEEEWTLDPGAQVPVVGRAENGWWLVSIDDPRTRTECCWVGAGTLQGDASAVPLIASLPPAGSCP